MLSRIFHIAVNVTDLDRSVAFYKRLGFQVLADRTVANEHLSKAFVVPSTECRFVHLRLGDDEQATVLDVVEWFDPPTAEGSGVPMQNQTGITRFAVLTEDTDRVYRELSAEGVRFLTEPATVLTPQGGWKVALAVDPDGVVIQVTQLLPPPAEA
jgi:catechol 2,3-dioxygenase-like lactoylglutathione lyase family enzyme